jgi:cysteinyl-tRNA synthetase
MTVDYIEVIAESRKELAQLLQDRERTDRRIAQLNIALRSLARLLPPEEREKLFGELKNARRKAPTLMEAISDVLANSKDWMASNEIREQLENAGFDLSEYSQPLATIFTTLNRLAENGRVKKGQRDKLAIYKWNRPVPDSKRS